MGTTQCVYSPIQIMCGNKLCGVGVWEGVGRVGNGVAHGKVRQMGKVLMWEGMGSQMALEQAEWLSPTIQSL